MSGTALNLINGFTELAKLALRPLEIINSIPNVIWAAGIAALATVYGVSKNIQHDTEQRIVNRDLELKREVYLDAINSISKGIYRIANISLANIEDENIQLMNGMELEISSAYKVSIVASNETFQKSSELVNLMNSKLIDLYLKKVKIYFFDQKVKVETGFLTNEYEKVLKQSQSIGQKYNMQMELAVEIAIAVEEVNQKAMDVMISIRKDLNLPVDIDSILEVGRKNVENARNLIEKTKMGMAKELNDFLEFARETTKKYVSTKLEEAKKEDGSNPLEEQEAVKK